MLSKIKAPGTLLVILVTLTTYASLALSACSTQSEEVDLQSIHREFRESFASMIDSQWTRLSQSSDDLVKASQSCEVSGQGEPWQALALSFAQFEPFLLSPWKQLESQIHSWPTRVSLITSALELDSPSIFDLAPLSKGIWSLEYFIYEEQFTHSNSCALYQAQVLEIQRLIGIYQNNWESGQKQEFIEAQSGVWMDSQEAISEILLSSISVLEILYKTKLDKPVIGNGDSPWPQSLQAYRSQSSREIVEAQLAIIAQIWQGTSTASELLSTEINTQLETQLNAIFESQKLIPKGSYYQLLSQGETQALIDYKESIYALLVSFSVDMSSHLNVENILSDNDGD